MISLYVIITLLFSHWLFDFVMQTDWQAKNKSTNNIALLEHTATYAAMWVFPGLVLSVLAGVPPIAVLAFIDATFVCHTITDYFTSRLNSYLWKKGDVHNFFVSVGFDQFLHYIQLLITYKLLF